MIEAVLSLLDQVYHLVWGIPLLALLIGVGIYYTVALRAIQFRYLLKGLRLAFGSDESHEKHSKGDISHFQSLMTALAATIGIGNIAGVATAFVSGGMGAMFWMWVTALVGMAIKYAEAVLAVKYRVIDGRNEMAGGPMYFIDRGLGWKKLALSFAFFGALAALGGGNMLQANSVAAVMKTSLAIDPMWTAIVLSCVTGLSILGGIKSIGKITSLLVPLMALVYVGGCLVVLACCYDQIPRALYDIVTNAFTGQAALGGFLGSSVAMAVQVGVSRGVMTSEAGLGTASIASAAAKTSTPVHQGLVSMTGSFLATILMCSATALVLGVTNVFGTVDQEGKLLNGAAMTMYAFESVLPYGSWIVSIGLVMFAFTTLIGWAYYGERCVEYLFGEKTVFPYRILFTLIVAAGAMLELEVVWKLSDIFNGLMAFPNVIGILLLSPVVIRETKHFIKAEHRKVLCSKGQILVPHSESSAHDHEHDKVKA